MKKATHGQSRGYTQSKAYRAYVNMCRRCYDPSVSMYPHYSGRGITVCDRWRADRAMFFADMGDPPAGSSLDRIDNTGGYWCGKAECPECGPLGRVPNCRWASAGVQANNKANNRLIEHAGRTLSLADWSREAGIEYGALQNRLDVLGWSVERALTEPTHGPERFDHDGLSLTLDEWAARTGIPRYTIAQRIKKLGWSVARAVTTPNKASGRKPR